MKKRRLSTADVARKIGVAEPTLERWLLTGKVREPKRHGKSRKAWRVWTAAGIKRARDFKLLHGGRWPKTRDDR